MKDIRVTMMRPGLYEVTFGNCVVLGRTVGEAVLAVSTIFHLRKVDGIQLMRAPFVWQSEYESLKAELERTFNGTPVELIQVSAFRKRV